MPTLFKKIVHGTKPQHEERLKVNNNIKKKERQIQFIFDSSL